MRVYLDYNAAAPLVPSARRALEDAAASGLGNPSSLHAEGRRARAALEQARASLASFAACSPSEVVFTSGATEAINAALRGAAARATRSPRRVVVGAVEHSAVLETARALAASGFSLVEVPCDRDGTVDAGRFLEALGDGAAVAALQAANPETGTLQPAAEVARGCRARGIPFLCDAAQAAGRVPLDAYRDAAMLAISSHKLGGPAGVGVLVVRDGTTLVPSITGGPQERRRRAGTEPVALAGAFAAAALEPAPAHLAPLRDGFESALRAVVPDVRIHGAGAPRLPNTSNFAIPGADGELLVIALDLEGISVSTGSACASGAVEPSHVIRAMGYDEAEARGAVRVSMGPSTSDADVERLLEVLPRIAARLRASRAARC
ncbi:MAG TPA: cysteine desulfurase family protein [Candidatus Polarisedimenticolaceae bacterium]